MAGSPERKVVLTTKYVQLGSVLPCLLLERRCMHAGVGTLLGYMRTKGKVIACMESVGIGGSQVQNTILRSKYNICLGIHI